MDLKFEKGRAIVKLVDGTTLSIINSDRTEVIRDALASWPLPVDGFVDAQATDDTYEVAILLTATEAPVYKVPDLWAERMVQNEGWNIYPNMPIELIEAYANEVGILEE